MKTLQELTLLDRFLFDEAMEDQETYEALLRILLGDKELKLLIPSQTEKEFRTAPWLRSIRVDVYTMDESSTIYNTEMQKYWREDLIKRSRYYQALIDSSLLEPGEINFNKMKNTTIIMIMPFDLFGKERYIYTFEGTCMEDKNIQLGDGSRRIFINTHGKNDKDVSPEFIALMNFIEYNEVKLQTSVSTPDLEKIRNRVAQVKASEKVGVRFMNRWEEEDIIRHDAREEGVAQGKSQRDEEKILEMLNNGKSAEDISEFCNYPISQVKEIEGRLLLSEQ